MAKDQVLPPPPPQTDQKRLSHQVILNTVYEQSAYPSGNNGV